MSRVNNPENSLPYYIRGAFRGFETALGRYLVQYKLPISQFYILRLQWNEAGNSQIDIAERAFMTESVASQVLKKMEISDLVRRKDDPSDRRSRLVQLTQTGKHLRERIVTEGIALSNENAAQISREDIMTTIDVLRKVQQSFDAYNQRTGPS